MEELSLENILTVEETENLFGDEENDTQTEQETKEIEQENNKPEQKNNITEVDENELFDEKPESVGSEDANREESTEQASSQNTNFYSSYAKALKEDGTLSHLADEDINNIKSGEDLVQAFKDAVSKGIEEGNKRAYNAINLGIEPSQINQYENTIKQLDSIDEKMLSDESEKGENLRKWLIYNDYINRGYSKERATKEVQKSINASSDLDDAKDALQSNKDFWNEQYNQLIKQAEAQKEEEVNNRKKEIEDLKKSMIEGKAFGDLELEKSVRQKAFECIAKPIGKNPDTNESYTEIEKYEKEHPIEFLKNIGLLYTLTDGFKNIDKLVKNKVNKQVKESIRNLERTINNTARTSDGNLKFVSGVDDGDSTFNKWDIDV